MLAIGIIGAIATILHLKRVCPSCRREQVVPLSKKEQTVACKFCGAEVPPRR